MRTIARFAALFDDAPGFDAALPERLQRQAGMTETALPIPIDPPAAANADAGRIVTRFAIFVALAGALLLAVLAVAAWMSRSAAAERFETQARSAATLLGREAARIVESADLALLHMTTIAQNADWSDPASAEAAAADLRAAKALLPAAFRMFVWDRDGRILASTVGEVDPGLTAADRAYFEFHRDAAGDSGLYVGAPSRGEPDGARFFVFSRRVPDADGGFGGAVSVAFETDLVTRLYRSADFVEGASFAWMRADGAALTIEPTPSDSGAAEGAERPLAGFAAAIRDAPFHGRVDHLAAPDGAPRSLFYQKVGGYPLYVAVDVSQSAARRAWLAGVWPYLLFAALALSGLGVAAAFALRWAHVEDKYRQDLAKVAARLGEANARLERRVIDRTASLTEALEQRERILRQKELLFREVNHRVKNSLQLIASLLRLQGRGIADDETRRHFDEAVSRVTAVARMHEQLYKADRVDTVEVVGYLRAMCVELERSGLAEESLWRIEVQGAPADLPTDQAIPLALILNELIANAFKHGEPQTSGADGWTLRVALDRAPNGKLRMTLRDHGRGLPGGDLPDRPGSLGAKLIRALVGQLGGDLRVEDAEPGARFVLTF